MRESPKCDPNTSRSKLVRSPVTTISNSFATLFCRTRRVRRKRSYKNNRAPFLQSTRI